MQNISIFWKYSDPSLIRSIYDSLLCQIALLHHSSLLAHDIRIIIKEKHLSGLHWFAHKFAQSILKLGLKRPAFYFLSEIFWQKRERPFNFIASRTLKYSLRSTFCFQLLCGWQHSWHLCMYASPIHNAIQPELAEHICTASDPSIPVKFLLLACTQSWGCPEKQHSCRARVQTVSSVLKKRQARISVV